jgi:hypothetical protein
MRAPLVALLVALLPALGGCTVLAVGGAAVSVASTAVSATYAVTKGAVNVATYPFRDSEEEKEEKRKKEEAEQK